MIQEIQFSGYSTNPSDYLCPDGELSASMNMLPHHGSLIPVAAPRTVLTLNQGESVLLVHHVAPASKYIIARTSASGNTTVLLCVETSALSSDEASVIHTGIEGFRNVVAIGNTLAVATDFGMQYLIWRDGSYVRLGQRPAFTPIEFGSVKVATLSDSEEFQVDAALAPDLHNSGAATPHRDSDSKVALTELSNMIYGQFLGAVADKVRSKGYYYQPFFVRYAYRLFDGSYSWHSAPVLILPSVVPPMIRISSCSAGDSGKTKCTSQLNVPYFKLVYRVLSDAKSALANWKDIVAAVDIFVSAPVYTFAQGKDLALPAFVRENVFYHSSPSSGQRPSNNSLRGQGATIADDSIPVFIGHYADSATDSFSDHVVRPSDVTSGIVWNIPANEDFVADIRDTHDFYRVASIELDSLTYSDSMKDLPLEVDDLTEVQTLPRLPDDYMSHASYAPACQYVFNNRLNLGGLELFAPECLPLRSLMECNSDGDLVASGIEITVWSRINGVKTFRKRLSSLDADRQNIALPRYIFHPDPGAYKLRIKYGQKDYIIPLTTHDFLNGAYCYLGLGITPKAPDSIAETAATLAPVPVRNKVYTSEVNNPFLFRPENINTVGSGDIVALCSAVMALSQGQFGQFPMYAFTSEGIWAMEVSGSGGFISRQPVSRDVCLSSSSILQIDGSVVFASVKGIMKIAGAQTVCISDAIDALAPFDASKLSGLSSLHATLGHKSPDTCFPTLPFSEFLAGMRMAYSYSDARIMFYNPDVSYAYVLSILDGKWGMMESSFKSTVNAFPHAFVMTGKNTMVDLFNPDPGPVKALVLSRPLKLDAPDVLKTVDTVLLRGCYSYDKVSLALYGSRDLRHWVPVWNGKARFLRGFRGSPYKYFRIAVVGDFSEGDALSGATFRFTPRRNDRPR